MSAQTPRRGFTLVEMLVVLGIIAVLIALLAPAVMSAVNNARRAAIATEIKALDSAITQYKEKTGDFPPNFRSYNVFIRHVRQRWNTKIDPTHLNLAIQAAWGNSAFSTANPPQLTDVPVIDEGESLVLWLYLTDNDSRYPFKWVNATNKEEVLIAATSPEKIYPFKEDRLVDEDGDRFPAYRALYSKDTCYIHIDHRSYQYFVADFTDASYRAYADGKNVDGYYVRPYWSEIKASTNTSLPTIQQFKPMNPTTFQIICAGQDGLFGLDQATPGAKFFPGGGSSAGGAGYTPDDRDNMTNFSEGRRLEDHIP
jgi:type II secretion system protein G